ncbi:MULTISPECIES: hypothetical protein [Streptacidiphilus]|uniref:Uncharacterized protein n=1 Tax=Streptacidiphilus cavernicola TaxID=3342716 RepID=A0ABV6UPL0_9ACTN|nr:hypothetical protein [Streptacidiphilus jeojiense]
MTAPVAGGAPAYATPTASVPPPPGVPRPDAVATSSITLPGGDRVIYQGASGSRSYDVVGHDGRTAPFLKFDPGSGHDYVIPASALSHVASLDPEQYDVPQLSRSAASPATQASQTPAGYPLHIVQINANDLTSAPAQNALSFVMNVDSRAKFAAVVPDIGGVARVAVPVGNYAIYTGFAEYDASGNPTGVRLVLQDDLVVPDSSGVTTVTADERAATAQVSAATPRPAKSDNVTLNVIRTDAVGNAVPIQAVASGNVFVSPQGAPAIGKLGSQVVWDGESPAGAGSRYRYDLVFPQAADVPANERFPVAASGLASLHYTFDTDSSNTAHTALYEIGMRSDQLGGMFGYYPVTVPERLTDYVTAPLPSGFSWLQSYFAELGRAPDEGFAGLQAGDVPSFAAGQQVWRTWGHGPLGPQVGRFSGPSLCYSCVAGTTMGIAFNGDFTDSEPETPGYYEVPFGYPNPTVENFVVYRDGRQIDQEPGVGAWLNNIPQQTDTYRAVFDVDASGISSVSQATKTHTDLTFVYNPAGDPHLTLPPADSCYEGGGDPASCRILPMLDLNYQLNTDGSNTGHAVSVLDLTVGHESYDGQGSQAPATSAKVEVSFDGGSTWKSAATVPTVRNHYLAVWPNTGAKGSMPSLRITATDSIGGSISQTITNAYTIG